MVYSFSQKVFKHLHFCRWLIQICTDERLQQKDGVQLERLNISN